MDENNTPDAVLDASQLNAPGADGTVQNVAQVQATATAEAMTLSELNTALGKNFPSKEAAMKSVKDTFSYVGKKKEDIEREVLAKVGNTETTNKLASELEEMRRERFYDKNPQFADPSIRKFIESTGKNPVEVVETPEFKDIFTKISGYDESQKLRTVLESNPRLASTNDAFTKARELQKQGGSKEEVEALVTRGVLDSIGK